MAKIRIGIIGCGQISQHHMGTYKNIPDAEMVVCADINEATARASADKFEIPEISTNWREVIARDDIDAVDVCLHNNYHMPATVEALQAGKHVYCEKPMAGSYTDAKKMRDTALATGKHLHIQLSTLYANETRAAKELIDAGELGDLYFARSTGFRRRGRPYVDGYGTPTFVQKRHSAGGALYDMGVYHIARMLYLLGNPTVERISGTIYQKTGMDAKRREISGYDVEELGLGLIRFEGDKTMDLIESWAIHMDNFEGSYVVGTEGGVKLNPFGFFKSYGNIDMSATGDLGSARYRWDNVIGDGGVYGDSQRHWIAALQGQIPLLPTAEIALNTMLIQEGIVLSSQRRAEVSAAEVDAASVSTAQSM
ncbi:MAG: Gfo/Idh/MocA family protein [Fimbriimonas sp.]